MSIYLNVTSKMGKQKGNRDQILHFPFLASLLICQNVNQQMHTYCDKIVFNTCMFQASLVHHQGVHRYINNIIIIPSM
jgi:hypothetical protein